MRPDKILVLQDNQRYETKEMPLTNINSFWLLGIGYDITIGEDARGDPYISIAINRTGAHMKLQELDNSWRGKIIKIIGTGSSKSENCREAQRVRWKHLDGGNRYPFFDIHSDIRLDEKAKKAVDNTGQTHVKRKTGVKDFACAR